ncbi:YetF domain-containing protein [Virgibacillus dokdonensis]|uniref:YetF domain-containing protein n=1 Tax=Virgibacillus dokdonensis TaxID=302167 RepID=UPI0026B2E063
MNLRQKNISRIDDVEWATLEANGQIGYELKQEAQPATKGDVQQLYTEIKNVQQQLAQRRMLGVGLVKSFNPRPIYFKK